MQENKIKVNIDEFEDKVMYTRFMADSAKTVCVTGEFDITNLYKKRKKHKLNAMLCYCVLQAAQKIDRFHYSIKEDGLYYYKNVKTNSVIYGKDGQLYFPDYKYCDNFKDFVKVYDNANKYCYENCKHLIEDTGSLISTSAIIDYPFKSFSLEASNTFWDNFLLWGKYEKHLFKATLNITLRFHHALINGKYAADFFNELQRQIDIFK